MRAKGKRWSNWWRGKGFVFGSGQTHLNLLGFSVNNYYSSLHPIFFLSHFSFSTLILIE
jgi:hypothetical protein